MNEVSLWVAGVAVAFFFQGVNLSLQGWILMNPLISPNRASKISRSGAYMAMAAMGFFIIGLAGYFLLPTPTG